MDQLDPQKTLLLQEDVDSLSRRHRTYLDDYIRFNSCVFIKDFITLYSRRVKEARHVIEKLQEYDPDYSGKDTLKFHTNNEYFTDKEQVSTYWKKKVSYNMAIAAYDPDTKADRTEAHFRSIKDSLKQAEIDLLLCRMDEMITSESTLASFVERQFLNAYATVFDPHSAFLNHSEKDALYNSLGDSEWSFGLEIDKNRDGQIEIVSLTPGGAAWKNGLLKEGDILLSLKTKKETLEVKCKSSLEIEEFLYHADDLPVRFRVRKNSGSVIEIELKKERVTVEENTITAFVIDNSTSKLGYIAIPQFYSGYTGAASTGSAHDVAVELHNLTKEKVDGLILDLRFNGGGFLQEASEIAGFFLKKGPLMTLRTSYNDYVTVNDLDGKILFKKPIIILINEFSASAAEYLASTLQDYGRALIVGTESFGKASTQLVFPLKKKKNKLLGFAKITTQKFYRINGTSYQGKGVQPSIVFPSLYKNIQKKEESVEFALKNDRIPEQFSFQIDSSFTNIQKSIANSKRRIRGNKNFARIQEVNERLVTQYIDSGREYPLTLNAIHEDLQVYRQLWEEAEILENGLPMLSVTNTKKTKSNLNKNLANKEANTILKDKIASDVYIFETYQIFNDLLRK